MTGTISSVPMRAEADWEDWQDLTDILVAHHISRGRMVCSCGHSFRPGESFVDHHVQLILAEGFHK